MDDGISSEQKVDAEVLLEIMHYVHYAFDEECIRNYSWLSLMLQRKEQDIGNVLNLVKISKKRLLEMRSSDDKWESLLEEVSSFYSLHEIVVPNMDDVFVAHRRSRRKAEKVTNMHHIRVELCNTIIDLQLLELDNRFSKQSCEILSYVGCLNPTNIFFAFNTTKLLDFARLHLKDFFAYDLVVIEDQLQTYIIDMRSSEEFLDFEGIAGLAKKMVKTRRHVMYPLVYMLITLALTLPATTIIVERAFSTMKIIKNRLHSRKGDDWFNACLIAYIEKDVLSEIEIEVIMQYFQSMKSRREQL